MAHRLGVCTQTSLLRLGYALLHPAVSLLDGPHKIGPRSHRNPTKQTGSMCPASHPQVDKHRRGGSTSPINLVLLGRLGKHQTLRPRAAASGQKPAMTHLSRLVLFFESAPQAPIPACFLTQKLARGNESHMLKSSKAPTRATKTSTHAYFFFFWAFLRSRSFRACSSRLASVASMSAIAFASSSSIALPLFFLAAAAFSAAE